MTREEIDNIKFGCTTCAGLGTLQHLTWDPPSEYPCPDCRREDHNRFFGIVGEPAAVRLIANYTFVHTVENYSIKIKKGECATLVDAGIYPEHDPARHEAIIIVKLDRHHCGVEQYDNSLHYCVLHDPPYRNQFFDFVAQWSRI